jgi:modification methylase
LVNRHTLIVGDSRSMPEIESGSIQFIVTSPPYWNLKNYGRDSRFTIRHQDEGYSTYLRSIYDVLKEIKRVIEPGRFVAINVGTAVSKQGMKPLHADIIKEMENLRFTFKKEIIWAKPKGTQGLWQRGVTKFLKKEPFPCYFNLNIMHEYILIFQNEGQLKVNLNADSKLSEEFIKQVSWSIWEMPVSTSKGHPAPFPDCIPERLIRLYSFENETVLDPFGGSGTTMKAASMLNRNSIIYEINPEYVELIKNKVNWENPNLDSQALYDIKVRMGEESYNNS